MPVSGTQAPVSGTQAPVSGTQAPASGTQAPESGTQAPVSGTQAPVSGAQMPPVGGSGGCSSPPPPYLGVGWALASPLVYYFSVYPVDCLDRVDIIVGGARRAQLSAADMGEATITFSAAQEGLAWEVVGYSGGRAVSSSYGLMDALSGGAGVFARQVGARTFELGVDRPPAAVASFSVTADGYPLTDSVTGQTRVSADALRYTFQNPGARTLAISSYNNDGTLRGTLRRTLVVE